MRFSGNVGFVSTIENPIDSGIFLPSNEERSYKGFFLAKGQRYERSSDTVNDNIRISHRISIVSDPYLNNNLSNIRYVTLYGSKWQVTNIEVNTPRVVLTLGEVYNG